MSRCLAEGLAADGAPYLGLTAALSGNHVLGLHDNLEKVTRGRAIRQPHRPVYPTKRPAEVAPTVQEYMARWLIHVAATRRPTTTQSYEGIVRRYVIPVIGTVNLKDLRREHIDDVLSAASASLKPNTRRLLRAVIGIALNRAEKWEIVGARNVVRLTDPPRVEPRELIFLTPTDARRLLESSRENRLAVVYILALFCGLRRGELLALRWSDIDLEKREIHIRNTLHEEKGGHFRLGEAKSMSAHRSVSMPVTVAAALARHRTRQLWELRLLADKGSSNDVDWGLVITSRSGNPLSKSTLRENFSRVLRSADLPTIRIHDLRHSCASMLLGEGVGAQTVATFLGHSEVKTTLNIYGHVARSQTQAAAKIMDRLLGGEYASQELFHLDGIG
jgi:integrase